MKETTEAKAKRASELAYKYEHDWGACSQCTVRALQEVYNEIDNSVFRALGGFAAGGACEGDGICGAYAAGIYLFGTKYGRNFEDIGKNPNDPQASKKHKNQFILVKKLHDKFIEKYGSVICHQIHRKLYGRPYYIADRKELEKFDKQGAHDWGCTSVCGDAARWTVEILESFLIERK